MAYRFVRAKPKLDHLPELRDRLESGDIERMEPFGRAMTKSLTDARFDPKTGEAVWVEEDYCSPPLAMEREEVLDDYFETVTVVEENVDEAAGWKRIEDYPSLWEQMTSEA
ncbi:hypothetical protein [Halopiger djelfimassiliensis]|uniref:hypothetical protein n=1 Tax=Halopiger djelfimassiliensis TaxID=1293047 RepID=UPI000677E058|nr:hypothetical protein [Halopiger djelfimassiliensis]